MFRISRFSPATALGIFLLTNKNKENVSKNENLRENILKYKKIYCIILIRGDILQNETPILWYKCPKCGGKLLAIQKDTIVKNLPCKCKHCKKHSLITLAPIRAERVKSIS